MGICSTAASNARGNRWLPPSNGKSFDAAEKCAVVENVGCCCCWQQRRCLSLSSRFWQQQQGRLALKQRIAGICAQHKHAGGAPHARTTVPCQNHALGQRSTGVSQGQRSTLSGVTRHRAVICIGAQRGTRPQSGQRLWHPAAHGMILAHAHKRALHAHGAWCGEARAGCGTQRGHAPHGRILHRGTAWQRALPAKTGTRQHSSSHRHAHTMRTCTRLAPGALCAVRRPVLTGTLSLAQRD